MKESRISQIDRDNWKDNGERFHRIKLEDEQWASLFDTSHDLSEGDEVRYETEKKGDWLNITEIEKQQEQSQQPPSTSVEDRNLRILVPSSRKVAARIAESGDEVKQLGDEILADYFELISELQGKSPEEATQFLRGEGE